jgi:cytochrome P450
MEISDLNLADPELLPKLQGPPYDVLAEWREHDPVHWNPAPQGHVSANPAFPLNKGFWVLTRYEDVFNASREPLTYSSALGSSSIWDVEGKVLEQQRAGIMGMDPPLHPHVKRLVIPPFMPRNLDAFAPEVEETARRIIDEVADRDGCEFVFDVASRLPVYTFCVLMGIPEPDRERIFRIGNALADLDNPHNVPALYMELAAYAQKLAEDKRKNPDRSMISAYVHGQVDGESLSLEQIIMFFVTVAVAGHETTRNTAVHFIRLMNLYPDQYELLRSDLDRHLPNAINEVLRFSPPVVVFRRTAAMDIELRGKQIQKLDKIYLSYPAANRDPDMFPDPDRFDITRSNADKHLSFGTGEHVCLGARLALLQLRLLLKEVVTRLPDIRPVGPPDYLNSIMFHGLRTMPVSYTPQSGRP